MKLLYLPFTGDNESIWWVMNNPLVQITDKFTDSLKNVVDSCKYV